MDSKENPNVLFFLQFYSFYVPMPIPPTENVFVQNMYWTHIARARAEKITSYQWNNIAITSSHQINIRRERDEPPFIWSKSQEWKKKTGERVEEKNHIDSAINRKLCFRSAILTKTEQMIEPKNKMYLYKWKCVRYATFFIVHVYTFFP